MSVHFSTASSAARPARPSSAWFAALGPKRPGYNYSAANKDSGITWDEATFREYIKDPKAKIPGTKMIYAGLKDEQKSNDLLAYLKQFDADGKKK